MAPVVSAIFESVVDRLTADPEVMLRVSNMPMSGGPPGVEGTWLNMVERLPAKQLERLAISRPWALGGNDMAKAKKLITAASNLAALEYRDHGQGRAFDFEAGERMPAVRALTLDSYDWSHSVRQVEAHWDFSSLRELELCNVSIYSFLSTVKETSLDNIRALSLVDAGGPRTRTARHQGMKLLKHLLAHHVPALEKLSVRCAVELLDTWALAGHGKTLKSLTLRHYVGFQDEARRCPTLAAGDVQLLAQCLTRLEYLELDADWRTCDDGEGFVRGIVAFQSLQCLALHASHLVTPPRCFPSVMENEFANDDAPIGALSPPPQQQQSRVRPDSVVAKIVRVARHHMRHHCYAEGERAKAFHSSEQLWQPLWERYHAEIARLGGQQAPLWSGCPFHGQWMDCYCAPSSMHTGDASAFWLGRISKHAGRHGAAVTLSQSLATMAIHDQDRLDSLRLLTLLVRLRKHRHVPTADAAAAAADRPAPWRYIRIHVGDRLQGGLWSTTRGDCRFSPLGLSADRCFILSAERDRDLHPLQLAGDVSPRFFALGGVDDGGQGLVMWDRLHQ
jgi:hypothetical protein